jgi:hypothetical protein
MSRVHCAKFDPSFGLRLPPGNSRTNVKGDKPLDRSAEFLICNVMVRET